MTCRQTHQDKARPPWPPWRPWTATSSETRQDRMRLPPGIGSPSPRLVGVHPNEAGPPHGYPLRRAVLLREFEAKRSAVLGI